MRYLAGVVATLVLLAICTGLARHLSKPELEVVARREVIVTDFEQTRQAIERELVVAEEAADTLALSRATAESELQAAHTYQQLGQETLDSFRAAFQDAESTGAYPVMVEGTALTREDLIERAELSLAVQANAAEFLPTYEEMLASIATLKERIDEQIATANMMTNYLGNDATRREFERDRSRLTLLARQVETLSHRGDEILSELDKPVPKLGEMIQTMNIEQSAPETDARVLDFLRSHSPQD